MRGSTENMARAMQCLGDSYGYTDIDKKRMALLSQKLANQAGQQYMGSIQSAGQQQKLDPYTGYTVGLYKPGQLPLEKLAELDAKQKNEQLQKSLTPKTKEKKRMFGFAKEYLDKHKDTVMTVVVALLVDHFFLGGALREKIKQLTESILDNAQKKLSHTPNAEVRDASKSAA